MASIVSKILCEKCITHSVPDFLIPGLQYEVVTGSVAYGIANEDSDWDIYGFTIPPQEIVFPHLAGEIEGFGRHKKRFEQFEEHHVEDKNKGRLYDITIFNIVKFFSLCCEGNPNMVDTLFVPENCVLYATNIGKFVRENRRLFLHKGCFHKFKGYSFSQMHKMKLKQPEPGSNREELIKQFGFDVKFATHVVRLLLEVEQILTEGDIDLQRHREQLKAIRRGEWTEQQIEDFFAMKEKDLKHIYNTSTVIPYSPDEEKIKHLLLNCLTAHYEKGGKFPGDPTVRPIEETLA